MEELERGRGAQACVRASMRVSAYVNVCGCEQCVCMCTFVSL